jgi:hypothetical protein
MIGCRWKRVFNSSCRLILPYLLLPSFALANEPDKTIGARGAGLSNSTIALVDPWSIFSNQAGLGWQRDFWVGIHHENRYFVKELNNSSLSGCFPVKPGTFGVAITHFGYKLYSQSQFGLSYGMMLSKNIAAGVGINYHSVRFSSGYGSASCVTAEGGIIYQPFEKIAIGAHVFNPSKSSLGSSQNISTSFGIGLAYRPAEAILITLQGDDNSSSSPAFRTGIEYSPAKRLSIRTGFSSNPVAMAFGLGWKVKSIIFDLAFSYHEVLGYSPFVSLSYTFSSKKSNQATPEK